MAAGSTYTPIQTITSSGSTSTMSFTSIPSTYTDLVIVGALRTASAGANMTMNYNGSSSTIYSGTWMGGNGSTASSGRESGQTRFLLSSVTANPDSTNPATFICNIMNYANTSTYKTSIWRWNVPISSGGPGTMGNAGLFSSTSAINQVTITSTGTTFTDGSTLTLYGILAA